MLHLKKEKSLTLEFFEVNNSQNKLESRLHSTAATFCAAAHLDSGYPSRSPLWSQPLSCWLKSLKPTSSLTTKLDQLFTSRKKLFMLCISLLLPEQSLPGPTEWNIRRHPPPALCNPCEVRRANKQCPPGAPTLKSLVAQANVPKDDRQ